MACAYAINALLSALMAMRFLRLTDVNAFLRAFLVTINTFLADAIFFTAIFISAGVLAVIRADFAKVTFFSAFLLATLARFTSILASLTFAFAAFALAINDLLTAFIAIRCLRLAKTNAFLSVVFATFNAL